ncbi:MULTISPECIES: CHASE2 domain-containing protein [Cyanophyceae]|uniref:TIR domain-containing protein n=1 Tax=Leptolyngbya subtilissima DQ-A4 TaxID=2933933 RepID=A0ABV0K332_9CYAN|nr:CHASE2 domain-containing protein [Nodosilinea sp. FACHB-141]MBD2113160.1 TIR domain-containing protein [Nodosilinea sp. FACHB-141]
MQLQDAFISYGRPDSKDFAVALCQRLIDLGYRVWLDQTDIPFAVNYQTHIDRSIEKSHNLIFIISPHSVNSPYCTEEIEQALRYNKRIIPLMHVGQISRETWQRRHPKGTEADWIDYQTKGLHSASRNIHPGIAKLNRISCRDGLDDPNQYLAQLVQTLEDRKVLVHQHTQYLMAALTWVQNQRQSRYLLIGAVREAAEAWLKQAFEDEPPFCQPTNLHGEFVTSSTKYADSRLAQVFLCYDEAGIAEIDGAKPSSRPEDTPDLPAPSTQLSSRLRYYLMRAGFTVWDWQQDLATGDRIQTAIAQGIEGADNFVFLLSAYSASSARCLSELTYALSLSKRVIPVLTEDLASEVLPAVLQNVQLLDIRAQEYLGAQIGSRQLIATLRQDAAYLRIHKLLLVAALKWERQRRNPSVLLRGGELRQAQNWLKAAQTRPRYAPVEIQAQFVSESLTQPATQTLDVFLIADPADLDFARRLNATLQLQSKSTWFDQSIRVDTSNELAMVNEALENAQNCLVVVSAHCLKNPSCLADLGYAKTLQKRIVAVSDGSVARGNLPPTLVDCPWVNFQAHDGDYSSNFGELYRILESDAVHVDRHTRLLVRALEWDNAGREPSLLLRGRALDQANDWLAQAAGKVPVPNQAQLDYLVASRQLPFRKVKLRSVGLVSLAVTLVVAALRLVGALQPLELATYDALMRRRPSEPQDSHLLIVTVDEASGDWLREQVKQGRYPPGLGTIPDRALAEVLATLSAFNPAAIGLDFYRDFAADPALAAQLRQSDTLFGICKATYEDTGVDQPPELPSRQVGFNDFAIDANNFVRRHYLKHQADPPTCDTAEAFSLRLVRQYLEGQGVPFTDPFLPNGGIQDMTLGPVRVPQLWAGGILTSQAGGYTPLRPDTFNGYQTMVNYRTYAGDPNRFAPQVTFQAVMMGQVDPALVTGRIVLIGYRDLTDRNADSYNTPQGELPGVVVHGQMISQLVNAALENRALIWWWPVWAETPWIGLWALIGGLVARQIARPWVLIMGAAASMTLLVSLSYAVLVLAGGWLPLIPALVAGFGTAGLVEYLSRRVRNP